jgi:integrase
MAQKWDDINLKERHLRVTKAKARTPARRLVTLPPAAVEWLMACPRDSELIGPSWGPDHVRKHLRDASIDCPENALRHSFISYRCASTGSVDTTAQDAGNTAKIVFQHYRALVTKPAGKEWFAVSPNPAKAKASKVVSFPEKKTA